jgi:hypothetical protein
VTGTTGQPEPARVDNGLRAVAYVPLTDVDPTVGAHLLTALGRARIPAYLSTTAPTPDQRRLYVASEERVDARTIVAAAVRALGGEQPAIPDPRETPPDPLAGLDTDAEFQALIADWYVDTVAAVRDAERDLNREDADWRARLLQPPAEDPIWLDDDHYVPPPPPPLPRLSGATILGMLMIASALVVLGLGATLGLGGGLPLVLGLAGLTGGVAILLSRVRDFRRDDDDDGAAI